MKILGIIPMYLLLSLPVSYFFAVCMIARQEPGDAWGILTYNKNEAKKRMWVIEICITISLIGLFWSMS